MPLPVNVFSFGAPPPRPISCLLHEAESLGRAGVRAIRSQELPAIPSPGPYTVEGRMLDHCALRICDVWAQFS